MAPPDSERTTESGIPVRRYYTAAEAPPPAADPGEFPYTRGVRADGYRSRAWTMRQYAGFGSADETNKRFHLLLERGQTGLSVAFDLPTQLGLDSDHELARGEVGRTGVAIDSLEDMERLLDGIPLGDVSTSMTINAPASLLMLLYELVAAGLKVDEFASRLSFFFNAHNDVFQEIAKFRAARRLWAHIMRDRFGAEDPRSQALRFHAQTGGSTLTAQQPEVNVVRVALQAFSAVAGGCQSLHTNGFDEALALPTEHSATLALRTQQVLANEAGTTATADPFGGSYYIEFLTDELERRARELIEEIDGMGGAVTAIETGAVQDRIEEAAFAYQRGIEEGTVVVVGVNRFQDQGAVEPELHRLDPGLEARQAERTQAVRAGRDAATAAARLDEVRAAAHSDRNLLEPMRDALEARCTIGEICEVLREEWGTYDALQAGAH